MNSRKWILAFCATNALSAASFEADSARGARLFETLSCIQCHSVSGKGGSIAPDLGRLVDRNFNPASLAATMWNHAPAMWSSMRERQIAAGTLDERGAGDLFAYFYSARFFDKPGDASRGKRLFSERRCTGCHGLTSPVRPSVRPASQWTVLSDSIALAEAMWNHRYRMMSDAEKIRWPDLSAQDLSDILVYLRNLPSPPLRKAEFRIGAGADGSAVFNAKGCAGCHRTGALLATKLQKQTLTEIAASMWNHAPKMAAAGAPPVQFDAGEMRELLGFLWAERFFENSGRASTGQRVFAAKQCSVCHNDPASGAPSLAGRQFSGASMVAALWHHGPAMLEQMKTRHVGWPRFEGSQMSDLIAFLNSSRQGKQ